MSFVIDTNKNRKRFSKNPRKRSLRIRRKKSSSKKRTMKKSKGKMKMVVPMKSSLEYKLSDPQATDRKEQLLQYLETPNATIPFNDGINFCNVLGITTDEQAYEEIRYYKETDNRFTNVNVSNLFKNSLIKTKNINIINQGGLTSYNQPFYNLSPFLIFLLKIPTDTTSRDTMLDQNDPNKLIGKGAFGIVYQGLMKILNKKDEVDIVIKEILRGKNVDENIFKYNIIIETSIQSHLYCSYNKHLQSRKNSGKIPKIHFITGVPSQIELEYGPSGPSGPTIIKSYGIPTDPPRYLIGMEKMDLNLSNYIELINDHNMEERENMIRNIVKKLCNLIVFLQQNELFVHRDLHCGNVMIDSNDNCYLIDFGCSALISRNVDTNPSQYKKLDIKLNNTIENKMHNVKLLNPSHDIRMLCASILDQPDLPPKFQRILAKRFCMAAWTYADIPDIPNQKRPLFHNFYNSVYNRYDFRFDPNVNNDMFEDFEDLPLYYNTPTPNIVLTSPIDTRLKSKIRRIIENIW